MEGKTGMEIEGGEETIEDEGLVWEVAGIKVEEEGSSEEHRLRNSNNTRTSITGSSSRQSRSSLAKVCLLL